MVKIELNTREYNDNNFACNYIELKWPIFLHTTSAKFDWCDVKMADVMSFNSGHFGWCHLEKFRKRCTHIPLIPCHSAIPFLRYDFFKIWPWKSKVNMVKVMGEGNIESHKVGVTSYPLTSLSFHVNRPFHSRDTAFSKFDLENPRSRSNDHDAAQLQV